MSAPKGTRISRPELARALGLDRTTITKWATGHCSPRDLEAVARELGVSIAEIFAGKRIRKGGRA